MSDARKGGPAFVCDRIPTPDGMVITSDGMTMRDYFAAKAMQGFISAWGQHDVEDFSEISSDSYMLADAMLKQRDAA